MTKLILIEAIIILTCFWLCYYFIFRKMKWLVFNRIILLSGIFISTLVPLINVNEFLFLTWPGMREKLPVISLNFVNAGDVSSQTVSQLRTSFIDIDLFSCFYLTVTILLVIRLVLKISKIARLIKRTRHSSFEGITLCSGEEVLESFSFFKYVFIPPSYSTDDVNYILQHEKAHAYQFHSIDILLMELYIAICWINPLGWLYKKFMKENHEFLADAAVVSRMTTPEKNKYKIMILQSQISNQYHHVVNTFNFSPYKNRIIMIDKNQITLKARICYLGTVCMILILITFGKVFSSPTSQILYDTLDKKPSYVEGKEQLMKYFMKNIRYPKVARENQTQGTFIVAFIVDAKGKVKDAKIIKEMTASVVPVNEVIVVGYNVNEKSMGKFQEGEIAIESEVIRLVSQLGDFNPGMIKGNPVEVQMAVPFKFRIE